jgi:hypothetical protein
MTVTSNPPGTYLGAIGGSAIPLSRITCTRVTGGG